MIDTAYRFPSFGIGRTVGDGSAQYPTEDDRVGRKCVLLDAPLSDEDRYDNTALKFVHYLEVNSVSNYWRNKLNA